MYIYFERYADHNIVYDKNLAREKFGEFFQFYQITKPDMPKTLQFNYVYQYFKKLCQFEFFTFSPNFFLAKLLSYTYTYLYL